MATVTTPGAAAGVQANMDIGVSRVQTSYALAANPTANDVYELVKIPKDAYIMEVICSITDVDSSTGFAFEIGDDGDTDRFISSSTLGQTGGIVRLNNIVGHGYLYTADNTIDMKVTVAASGTFAAGTVVLTVIYSTSGR